MAAPVSTFPWLRITWAVWMMVAAVILLKGLIAPLSHSTYSCFVSGGADWLAGRELYRLAGVTCRYSPLFHAFMVPFSQVPDFLGSTVWRLLNWGFFLAGLWSWVRNFLPTELTLEQRAKLCLLILPLSIGSLHNAQANPMVLGMMLLAVSAVLGQRWTLASVYLVVALLIKLYPLALALLLLLLYPRRLVLPFLGCLAIGLGLPCLLQAPGYVLRQYANWYHVLAIDDRSQMQLQVCYRDVWLLLRLLGQPISHFTYQVIQLLMAGVVAGLCWWHKRAAADARGTLHWTLELSCGWMTVLGPATESCTYILLAPVLSWRLLQARLGNSSSILSTLLTTSYCLFLIAAIANWFPRSSHLHALGLQPLGGLLLLGIILIFPSSSGKGRRSETPIQLSGTRKSA